MPEQPLHPGHPSADRDPHGMTAAAAVAPAPVKTMQLAASGTGKASPLRDQRAEYRKGLKGKTLLFRQLDPLLIYQEKILAADGKQIVGRLLYLRHLRGKILEGRKGEMPLLVTYQGFPFFYVEKTILFLRLPDKEFVMINLRCNILYHFLIPSYMGYIILLHEAAAA